MNLGRLVAWLRNDAPAPASLRPAAGRPAPAGDRDERRARTDAFNRAADAHWRALRREPSAVRSVLTKPFSGVGFAPGTLYRLGLVLSELRIGLGQTVVDFGAGSCWLSLCLNKLGCRTVSIDVAQAALELGQEQFHADPQSRPELEPRFLVFDGHHVPLGDASVDRLVCFDAFHHVPNPAEVLVEFARVLRPGGRVVMAEPGEGHSHSDLSEFEMDRYGVYEGELDLRTLEQQALAAGFTSVRLKPYPDPDCMSLGVSEYVRLMDGERAPFPMKALQTSLRHFFVIVLAKGEEPLDSRRPGRLLAEIRRLDEQPPRGAAGARVPLRLAVRNAGDTLWLHEATAAGGHVLVAGDLTEPGGRVIVPRFFSRALPRSVAPGETVELDCELPFPQEPGSYHVRVDMVDEQVMWFSQSGSQRLLVPIEVAPPADAAWADAFRARLEPLAAAPLVADPGTRVSVPLRLTNTGREAWPQAGAPEPETVCLGAHLLTASGRDYQRDLFHLPLPRRASPGESVELEASFDAPLEPGRYALRLDLVMELRFWFAQRGGEPLELPLEVTARTPDSARPGVLRALVELARGPEPLRAPAEGALPLAVRVTNLGNTLWRHEAGRGEVSLGVHLCGQDGRRLRELVRVALPHDVAPGASADLALELELSPLPRPLALELDLVAEGSGWFAGRGSAPLVVRLDA